MKYLLKNGTVVSGTGTKKADILIFRQRERKFWILKESFCFPDL